MTTSPALPPPLWRTAKGSAQGIDGCLTHGPWALSTRWPRSVGGVTATPHPWNTLSWFHYLPKPDDREDHNSDRSTPAGNSAPGASGKAGV